jgi:hypothetical protein
LAVAVRTPFYAKILPGVLQYQGNRRYLLDLDLGRMKNYFY